MDTKAEGIHRGFNATTQRLEIVRGLVLEFAGVVIIERPIPNDFVTHIDLKFTSAEQAAIFMNIMFQRQRQKLEE